MRLIRILPVISGLMVAGCLLYCRYLWTPRPMTLTDPDESIICWLFCYSLNDTWLYLGIMFSAVSITGGMMMFFEMSKARMVSLAGGILLLPAGLINLVSCYFYEEKRDIGRAV